MKEFHLPGAFLDSGVHGIEFYGPLIHGGHLGTIPGMELVPFGLQSGDLPGNVSPVAVELLLDGGDLLPHETQLGREVLVAFLHGLELTEEAVHLALGSTETEAGLPD